MEGTQCSQSGCNCHDFLPFECILCGDVYCLEHRSRFNHSCVVYAPENANDVDNVENMEAESQFSVKSMFAAVQNRFMGTDQSSSAKDHYKVKSSSVPEGQRPDSKFGNKLNKLENVATSSSSDKQRNISDKTRQMLIKNKALGNSEVPGPDRQFMEVYFIYQPTSAAIHIASKKETQPSYFYFNKNISIADMIASIKKHYSNLMNAHYVNMSPDINRDSLTLALITEDSPNWRLWNRNAILKDTFQNFEEISLFPMDLNEVVSNQAKVQTRPRVITLNNPIPQAASSSGSEDKTTRRDFVKGDFAWYHKASNAPPPPPEEGQQPGDGAAASSAAPMEVVDPMDMPLDQDPDQGAPPADQAPAAWERDEMLLVSVIGVHHDDFPNVYYTIQPVRPLQFINGANNNTVLNMHVFDEKQTDATHLEFLQSGDASGVDKLLDQQTRDTLERLGDPVPLRLSCGDTQYHNVKIGNMCTIGQLRQLCRIVTGVPVRDMKLICKGTVLKSDTQLIKSSKIVSGSKIIVMTTTSSSSSK